MLSWKEVIWRVKQLKPHVEISIPAGLLPPPETAGFQPSIGEKPGKHYRLPLPDGSGIHVRLHKGKYYVHWDVCDPMARGILCHLVNDAPHQIPIISCAASVAYELLRYKRLELGSLLKGCLKGIIVGGFILMAAALLYSPQSSPARQASQAWI